jgi:hypothetical protein
MLSGAMLINVASPPNFNIELATGRVRPQADKGLPDPPSLDDVDLTKVGITT